MAERLSIDISKFVDIEYVPSFAQSFSKDGSLLDLPKLRPDQEQSSVPYTLKFFHTSDVEITVRMKIETIEGFDNYIQRTGENRFTSANAPLHSDVYVTCQIFSRGVPMSLPVRTSYRALGASRRWNQWISIPVLYQDLPLDSQVYITVWDVSPRHMTPTIVGGTTCPLFSKKRSLKAGRKKLLLWPGLEGSESTPGKVPTKTQMARLEKLTQAYAMGKIQHSEWLDKLTFPEMNKINQQLSSTPSDDMFLWIEFLTFELPVVFSEASSDATPALPPIPNRPYSRVMDPESMSKTSPADDMHLKLTLGLHTDQGDRKIKPNARERRKIMEILHYTPIQDLSVEEKTLLWRFRYYLTREKKALTKFLRCVDWKDPLVAKEASKMMSQWVPIDFDDALELLSSQFQSDEVRKYAVQMLKRSDDDSLVTILLQLVQALRYEEQAYGSELANFLIARACTSFEIANYLHWYLVVEQEDTVLGQTFKKICDQFLETLQQTAQGREFHQRLEVQKDLVQRLTDMSISLKDKIKDRPKRIEKVRQMLGDRNQWPPFLSSTECTTPLNPSLTVTDFAGDKAHVFKSAKSPLLIPFVSSDGPVYKTIFKTGDDLRQDQLVMQLIMVMDKLLKQRGFDLKLTPYRVIATSSQDGMLECVENSIALAQVLADYRGEILKFFQKIRPDPTSDYGVDPEVIETFTKSCAGYCVITYILGIGDRHLDNLLLTYSGHLFHIDFGFILGRDPKPFPPPMKLCKEMVLGMGGQDSRYYNQFKTYCCEAFNILRKSANLIINLLLLMINANIPDISGHPDEKKIDPVKNILRVQDKFRLDLSDDEAVQHMQGLLNKSLEAIAPQVTETIHRWAQYWRS